MADNDRPGVRLNKLLAHRGIASRRDCADIVFEGRVTVNGEVVDHPGERVDPDEDHVRVDGKPLPPEPPTLYYLMYKPKGTVTTRSDPKGRKTVFDVFDDLKHKVEPVGRLDYDTEGALIFTNDGDLAHELMHPSTKVPKRYRAKVYRTPDDRDLEAVRTGVYLPDGKTHPARARVVGTTEKAGNAWVEVTVTEGRNRLIRRMFAQLGHPVSKLRRESFATISIRGMARGQVRKLTGNEIQRLHDIAKGVPARKAGH